MSRVSSTKKKSAQGPLRIIIRLPTGARISVPSTDPLLTLGSTLSQIISRVSLPFELSSTSTLVCLRRTAARSEWDSTTLGHMLDGDDGLAGVVFTLDPGDARRGEAVELVVAMASDINDLDASSAWAVVLRSNFDSASQACLLTLLKIIDNLLSRPDDPKVRNIRCTNSIFQQKVGNCQGALQFLYSLGFVPVFSVMSGHEPTSLKLSRELECQEKLFRAREVLILSAKRDFRMQDGDLPQNPRVPTLLTTTNDEFNVYKGRSFNVASAQVGVPDPYANKSASSTERQLQSLKFRKNDLAQQIQENVEMDRCCVAHLPGDGPSNIVLFSTEEGGGGGDSSLVAARMRRMEEERKKREDGGFTTKAMRELERMKKAKVYSHAQIRINFPDGTHLSAKFLPHEKVSVIRSVITSAFEPDFECDFELYIAPPRRLLSVSKTLEEEELVPAAKIHVSWQDSNANCSKSPGSFLRKELFKAGNESSFPKAKPILADTDAPPNSVRDATGNVISPSQEELMVARMLGKGGLLRATKPTASSSEQGGKKDGRPKWFK